MNWRVLLVAPAIAAAGGCTTSDLALFEAALSIYGDVSYLNGDCPFNLQKYHDREGHHHCSVSDESRLHRDGAGHHHDE